MGNCIFFVNMGSFGGWSRLHDVFLQHKLLILINVFVIIHSYDEIER
jgi:hypothetical protein